MELETENVVFVEVHGERWFKFESTYKYGWSEFTFNFYARSWEEAEAMLRGIKATAEITGQILEEIPN